ncbi:NlpC/P60 family protein [Streptomyces sp. NPDC048405]|uniref:C40 family peptidase n=1 Tax=Streptomyces TaxID=1883 RepID=UPI000D58DC0B|nr:MULTISPECIES: C40 family peptidase [Streptomyces]MBU6532422.1 C40 family peptidase [Streptomyces sp. A108]
MGTHRRPKPPSRSRLAVLAAAAGTVSLLPTQSQAAPKPSIDEVRQQVEELYEEAEAPTEEYNAILVKKDKLQEEAERAQEQVARQQQEINELRDQMGPVAAAQYRDGGLDPSVQLFLSSAPDDYLDKAARVDRLSSRQVSMLSSLEAKQRELAQTRTEAVKKLSEAEKARKRLGSKKEEIQGKLRDARKLLNSLTAEQRAELKAKEAKADKAAGNSDSPAAYNGAASGRARTAIDFAYAQLGKPYEWGSTGPNSFDCSGLTGSAWRAAGVSLPRTVIQQYSAGRKVAKSDLQPGDIIYWYNNNQHNGLYIGNGKAIHAPRTGKNVEITPLDSMPFFAASRP